MMCTLETIDSQYVINTKSCSDLFGCVGLRKKKYCILNKQYSKEAFEEMRAKIIRHMDEMPYVDAKGRVYKHGEFFPPEFSPFGYNETQAQEYFPLEREEASRLGFRWRESETKHYSITKTSGTLPDSIRETGDEVLQDVIECAHAGANAHPFSCESGCATAFRITPQELSFYRQLALPLPRLCFNCRHMERVSWRNPPRLYKRSCQCLSGVHHPYQNFVSHPHGRQPCPNEFETSYAQEQPEIVYCESCYQLETS
jgi:hypothetical protein